MPNQLKDLSARKFPRIETSDLEKMLCIFIPADIVNKNKISIGLQEIELGLFVQRKKYLTKKQHFIQKNLILMKVFLSFKRYLQISSFSIIVSLGS